VNTYIGFSGVAGAGKDLLFSLLSKRIKCRRLSLADALKAEVADFTKEAYGIDPLTCSPKDKEVIRPLLVFHGSVKRNRTMGRYWIDQMNNKILKNKIENETVIITDIRYDDYPYDEVHWLQEELKGLLVHISLIKEINGKYLDRPPANREEERNDPKIQEKADYKLRWPLVHGNKEEQLVPYINEFLWWFDRETGRLSACKQAEGSSL